MAKPAERQEQIRVFAEQGSRTATKHCIIKYKMGAVATEQWATLKKQEL